MSIVNLWSKFKRRRYFDEILCQELMIHESMCAYIQECRPEEKMTIEKLLAEIDSQGVTWDRFELQEMRKKYSMEEVDQNIKKLAEKSRGSSSDGGSGYVRFVQNLLPSVTLLELQQMEKTG